MFWGDYGFGGYGYNDPDTPETLRKSSQCFAMGYLFLFFAVAMLVLSPILLFALIAFILISLCRGLKNRFSLFTNGEVKDESYYIDTWVCFLFWIISGAAIGRIAGPETAVAAAMCSGFMGALLEGIYFCAQHMELPPMGAPAPRSTQWGSVYDYGYGGGTFGYKTSTTRRGGNWSWTGYHCSEGPKEDALYETS